MTLDDNVRGITGGAVLAKSECRGFAGNVALVHEGKPRKIGQMAFPARQKKSNGQCGWPLPAFTLQASLMNIFSLVGAVGVLHQLEDTGLDSGKGIAQGTTHPSRKRR